MKPVVRRLVPTFVAVLVFALAGCGVNNKSNGPPVSQAPAAEPDGPPAKVAKAPQVSPK